MKKIVTVILACAFVFAVSFATFALDAATGKTDVTQAAKGEKGKSSKTRSCTGKIKSLDVKANTVTVTKKVKGSEKEFVFSVTDKTKFKEISGLADLSVGDRIGVKFTEDGEKKIAKSVEKKASKAKKKGKKEEKSEDEE